MSGGSYNYAYARVEEMALEVRLRAGGDAKRLAFALHLDKVAKALQAIEWVDSNDWAPGDEDEPIRAVVTPTDEVRAALVEAHTALGLLQKTIVRAELLVTNTKDEGER